MNKIFKVIFNRTTQKMEVVSELARSQGKATASTDERGGNLFLNALNSTLFTGGVAVLALSAVSAEAAIHVVSTTQGGTGYVTTGQYQGETGVNTNPYNYYNPGSLSVEDAGTVNATNRILYDIRASTGIGLGKDTNVKGRNNGSNGIAIGDYSQATGGLSVAIGASSISSDIGSVALGVSSRAAGFNSFAAQRQSAAIGDYSAAIGSSSWANSTASFAIGASATALGERSFAIGSGTPQTKNETSPNEARRSIYDGQNNTYSYGNDAFAIGTKAKTNGNNAFAIGTNANAGGFKDEDSKVTELGKLRVADTAKSAENAFALGTNTKANSKDSVAFSTNAEATGEGAVAFGVKSVANGTGAIAFGNVSNTTGANAISIGWNATSTAEKVIAIGAHSTATKDGAMAIGETAKSTGNNSVAMGYYANVSEANATAVGAKSNVTKVGGSAIGFESQSTGSYATAVGHKAKAQGEYSLSLGDEANASGKNSSAIGKSAESSGELAIAIGNADSANIANTKTQASGVRAIAMGTTARANANDTIAIGTNTNISKQESRGSIAIGNAAGTQGLNNYGVAGTTVDATGYRQLSVAQNVGALQDTIAIGTNSHAYGHDSIAIGTRAQAVFNDSATSRNSLNSGAVAIGYQTIAQGDQSVALGSRAEAVNRQAMALGNDSFASGVGAIVIGGDDSLPHGSAADAGYQLDTGFFDANNKKYRQSAATGNGAVVVGVHSQALSQGSTAIGVAATAGDNGETRTKDNATTATTAREATAVGAKSRAKLEHTTAVGYSAEALGVNSTTVGAESKANSTNAFAGGYKATADGANATAIGSSAKTNGEEAIAIGTSVNVSGARSAAMGYNNTINATDTFVLGSNVNVGTTGSVVLGANSTAATAKGVDSATVGKLTYSGFAGDEAVAEGDYVSVGSDANERQIKFVAPGEISKTSTDAINGSQLYATNEVMSNIASSVNSTFGGNSVLNPNGTLTFTNIGGTGKDNIHDAIKAARTKVESGTNVNVASKAGSDGETVYTVNANHTTVSTPTGNKYVSVTEQSKGNNVTNYEVSLTADAIKDFTKDDNTITDVVDDKKGYVKVEEVVPNGREGDYHTYKVSLSDKAIADFTKDTHVTGGTVNYDEQGNATATLNKNDGTTAEVTGIKNNFVTSSVTDADGKKATLTRNDGGKVEIDLSKTVKTAVDEATEKGFGLKAQDGNTVKKNLGEAVEVVGGNNNINTTVEGDKVKVNLNNTLNLTNGGSVTIGDTKVDGNGLTINGGPNVTKNGINAGSKTITNVADGEVSATSKEAVNGSQLHATNQNVTNVSNSVTKLDEFVKKGFNITADKGNEDNVQLGEKITYTSTDKNIITTVSDNQIDFVLNSTLKIGGKDGAPGIGLDGANGTIGLTGPKGDNGESATANITVKNGKPGVDGKDGETKTRIVYDGEEVATLNDGLKFGANTGAVHNAKLNTQVNVKGAEANQDWSKFDQGQNIMTQINGNNITVALAKDVNLTETGSLTIGGITVNKDGVTINNTKITNDGDNVKVGDKNGNAVKITNVKDGELSNTSKDAVNGSQLYATNQNVTNLSNKVAEGFNIDADKRGEGLDKADNVQLGETVKYTSTDKNIITTVTNNTIDFGLANEITVGEKGEPGVAGKDGKDGKVGVKGADGSAVVLNGKDGSIGLNGKDGKDGLTFQGKDGSEGVDGTNGKDGKNGLPGENGKTRIVYQPTDKNGTPVGTPEEVATLNDGLIFTGNNEKLNRHKLNTVVKVVGEGVDKAASETFSSAKGNINVVANETDELQIRLNKDLDLTDKGSVKTGNTTVNNDGVTIAKKADAAPTKSDVKLTQDGLSNGGNQITNVDSGLKGKDGQVVKLTDATGDVLNNAVNVGDLKNTVTEVTTNAFGLKDENGKEFKQNLGTTAQIIGDSNIKTDVVEKDGEKALKVSLANNITVGKDGEPGKVGVAGKDGKDGVSINGDDGKDGKPGEASVVVGRNGKDGDNGIDGKVGVNGKDGSAVVLNGKDGSIGLNGKDGKDGLTIKGIEGKPGLVGKDGLPGKDGVTRIQYQPTNPDGSSKGEPEQVATLNDGLHFKGDNEPLVSKKLNETLEIVGGAPADKLTNNNIGVNNNGGKLVVQLAKELSDLNKATFVPKDGEDGATTVVDNNGTTITPKDGKNGKDGNVVSLTKDGLNNGNNQIVNVKSGIDGVKGQDGQAVKSVNDLTEDQLKDVGTNAANINDVANASKDLIAKGFKIDADNRDGLTEADTVELGQTVEYRSESGNIVTTVSNNKIDFDLADKITVGGLGKNGKDGVDGKIGVKGADGKDGVTITPDAIVFHGKDGANGQDGKPGLSISGAEGKPGLVGEDGKPGKNGVTRIQYQPTDPDGSPKGEPEQVATLNDGLHFTGNNSDTLNSHKLNTIVNIVGEGVEKGASETFVSAAGNINVKADGKDKLEIQLAKDLKDLNSATFGPKDGADAEPTTVVGRDGITITPAKGENGEAKDPVKLTQKGLDNGNNQIVNVKSGIDGLAGKDGINGKDGKPITSVNDLTKEQLEKVGTNGANINDVVNASNDIIEKGFSIAADRGETDHVKLGETVTYTSTDKNIITTAIGENKIDFALANTLSVGKDGEPGKPGEAGTIGVKGQDGKDGVSIKGDDGKDGVPGEASVVVGRNGKDGDKGIDGKVGVNGKDGSSVVLNGKDGSIGLTGPKGADGKPGASTNIAVKDGAQGVDGNKGENGLPGKNGETRIVYKNGEKEEQVANLNDGLIFTGNNADTLNRHKLNTLVKVQGEGVSKEQSKDFKSAVGNINVVAKEGDKLEIQLNRELKDLTNAKFVEYKQGDDGKEVVDNTKPSTEISNKGITITPANGENGAGAKPVALTDKGLDNGNNQIVNVKSGIDGVDGVGKDGQPITSVNDLTKEQLDKVGTNAANINDVRNATDDVINTGFNIAADNGADDNVKLGETVKYTSDDKNIITTVRNNEIDFSLADNISVGGKAGKDGTPGKDGSIGVKGADGKDGVTIKPEAIVFHGVDGVNGKDGTDGKDGAASIKVEKGAKGLAGNDGKDGESKTRIVYEKPNGEKEEVATLNDGLKFVGDDGKEIAKKLNETLSVTGGEKDAAKLSDSNIGVVNSKDGLVVKLAKDLKDLGSATFTKEGEGEPKTVVNNNGIEITPTKDGKDAVKLTENGLDNGNNQIVNVKSGIDGLDGKPGKDNQPVKSVNDLSDEQLDEVGNNAANIKDVRNATDGLINKGFNITADNKDLANGADKDNVKLGETVSYTSTDKNIVTTVRDNAIDFGLANNLTVGKDGKDGKPGEAGSIGVKGQDGKDGVSIKGDNGEPGKPGEATITVGRNGKDGADGDNGIDGKVGVNGKDGSAVVLNGKDGSIGLNGKDGKDGLTFKSSEGAQGVDGKDGKEGLPGTGKDGEPGKTRIVYQPTDKDGNPIKDDEGNPITEEVATLNDGLIFAGNNDKLNRHKLNSVVNIVGEGVTKDAAKSFASAAGNINVKADGSNVLEIQLNRNLKDLATANFVEYKEDGSVNADAPKTVVNNNGVTVTPKDGKDGKDGNVVSLTKDGLNNGGNQIVNVKSGINGLNGQNGKDGQPITSVNDLTPDQLKEVGTNGANINDVVNASNDIIEKGFSIAADNGETDHVKLGETVKYTSKDKNIITTVSDNVIDFALNNDLTVGGPGKDGQVGKDGSIGVKGADGTAGVTLNGKDGSIGLTGPKGADGKGASATISVKDGAKGLDGNDGKDGESKTRIVYEKPNGDKEEVATLNDGLRFVGDDGKVIDKKLNETLQISGGDTDLDDLSDDNIGVVNKNGKLVVKLAKNIDLTDEGSITIGDTFIDTNAVGVGDSALTGDSLTVGGDNAITVDGNKGTIGGLTNKTFDPNNFTSGQAATEDQLKQVYDVANSGWDIAANGQNTTNVGPKGKVSFNNEDGNIIITKETTDNNVTFALNNDLTIGGPGKDGAIGVKGADGKTGVTLNGKDGTIGINGKDGSNGTMTFEQGKPGVDGKDGETKTRIVYETKDKDGNPVKEEVATLNDGLKFVGDDGKVITKKLNETLSITGGEKDATKLSDANNIGVVNNNGTLTVKLAKDIDLTKDGSVTIGDTTVNNDGLTIKDGPSVTKDGISAGDKKITNVQDGEISSTSKDAVNGSQLYQVQQVANAGWNLTANGKDKGNVKPSATVDLNNKDGNIVITKEGNNVTFGLNNDLTIGGKDGKDGQIGVAGKDGKDGVTIKGDGTIVAGRDGQDGVDGSIGATGKDGASVVLNGKDGSIGLTGPKGTDGKPGASANITVKDGAEGVDGTNGKDGLPGENGKTRIVYETIDKDGKPVTEQVATLNDGLIFSGNNEETKNRQKLNTEVKVKGEGVDKAASENFKSASGNINVKANGTDTLEVQLAKAIDLTEDGSVTTGGTTVNNNGLTIKDGPSVTKGGIDAKDTKITNVKDGDVTATSKDAVNGSQLYNAIENAGWDLTVDGNVAADSEEGSKRVNNNGKVAVKGGKNIVVSRKGSTVEVATSDNPEFDSVKVGGTTIRSTVAKDGVNELNIAGSNNAPTRITNVAEGVKGTDAVNVNQLKGAENRLNNRINNVDKDLRAGIAGALAAGNLYHVTQPGKSMVSAGVGTYRGQGAMAVGYSRLSDNGKVGIKFSVNSNSRGHAGAAASVGYQW
ncbi:YadA-like family protein [Mannheimia indoligenes]|uniref:YadA-like family protein n=1 Tax=Mannheimia indoligenes TaxID=3103145 RepID=UPI002FE61BAA